MLNGILTFVDYLMLKPSTWKGAVILFNPYLGVQKVQIFLKGISPKVNVIARLELELAYFEAAGKHFSHYAKVCL